MTDKKRYYHNNEDTDFYEFDEDVEKDIYDGGSIEESLHYKDIKQRKLYIDDNIDQYTATEITQHILRYNYDDKGIDVKDRKPIFLYVVSNGGDVDAGFEIIDAVENSKTPVFTINLAYQYSMGFLIGLAGHTRYASKNAKFLLHDGSSCVFNSTAKVQDQIEFHRRVDEKIKSYIISHSNLTAEEYDSKLRVEWYLFADEAKQKGFTDRIIGEDCDIDDII